MNNEIVVLDTSVLLAEGKRIFDRYENTDLVIPLVVLKELESKRDSIDLGRPARSVIRAITELQNSDKDARIKDGISIKNGSTLRVELNNVSPPPNLKTSEHLKPSNDTTIIYVAYNIQAASKHARVTLATRDMSLAVFAELLGLNVSTAEYMPENRIHIDQLETHQVDDLTDLYKNGTAQFNIDVPVNTGVILRAGPSASAIAISKPGWNFTLVKDQSITPFTGRETAGSARAVVAKSKEQNVAMKLLRDDTIKFISLGGIAGGGKTMISLAEGVRQIMNSDNSNGNGYKKITVFRSMSAVGGEEMGFLPGTEQEKLDPWTQAIYDSLSSFLPKTDIDKLKRDNKIEVLPITHVRGRTFNNSWIIVDEAQNLTKSTILTLLTRVGQSSKIIMTHDISQRDNHRVGRYEGIYEVVSRFHGNKLFAHVSMVQSERSELAQTASALLDDF